MAQCKVHSCTLAQKRRLFISKTDLLNVTATVKMICYTNTHIHTPASIPFPSLEGSADSSILKAFRDFLYPGVPWPPTLTGHTELPQPSF